MEVMNRATHYVISTFLLGLLELLQIVAEQVK
jgi:hypothetical protein